MSTRTVTKRKRLTNTKVMNTKCKTSSSSSNKRSVSISKPHRTTRSSTSIHRDNIDTNDESSIEQDLLIDCPDQSPNDRVSTPKKVVRRSSKKINKKNDPLNSSIATKYPTTAPDDFSTENAYKNLEVAISICSPILGRVPGAANRNVSPFKNQGDSVVMGSKATQVTVQPPLSQITPITNRINLSDSSRISRSEPPINQHLSSLTIAANTVNSIRLSSNHPSSSNCTMESGIRPLGNNGLSNPNQCTNGTARNKIRSSISTRPTSTGGKAATQFTTSSSSYNEALLETIPEYRNLKKELELTRERCNTWRDDYKKVREEFAAYRATSFPRPSVDGLNFLLELVENLTASNTPLDSRTFGELAVAIGLSEEQLIDCRHSNPQRAALAVFSELYPSNRQRAKLRSIKQFAKAKSVLLDDIYIFARQCNSSTLYSTEKMRDAIAASIRQAKHQIRKFANTGRNLLDIDNQYAVDGNDAEEGHYNNNSVMDVHTGDLKNNHSRDYSADEEDRMDH